MSRASVATPITDARIKAAISRETIGEKFYPIHAAETAAGLLDADLDRNYVYGDAYRYKMIGDGVVDDAAAFANAVKVAAQGQFPLILSRPSAHYDIASAVTQASLSGVFKMIGLGSPEIRYSGAAADYVMQITDTNGHDATVDGVLMNADQKAATVLRVDNPSASMAAANIGRLVFRGAEFTNAFKTVSNTYAATGITIIGGFSEVVLDDTIVRNIDRALGAGTAGLVGSAGVLISYDNINSYVKKSTIIGGEYNTITNSEVTGNAADVDCDGISHSAPSAADNADVRLTASLTCWGTKFVDCKGRNLKAQLDGFAIVRDFVVVREAEEAINNCRDFDFTRGGATLSGGVIYLNEKPGGGTTVGASHSIVGWGPDQLATDGQQADGGMRISDITVYNSIPDAIDVLPFFCVIVSGNIARELSSFSLTDCAVVGGRLSRWVKSNAGNAAELNMRVEGCEADLTTSLMQFTASVDDSTKIVASNNRNLGANVPDLLELNDSSVPLLSGYNNTGFTVNYTGRAVSNKLAEVFRPGVIGGDTVDGHVMSSAQSVTLADDATHVFKPTGAYGIGIITSNWGDSAQVMFKHDTNSFLEMYQDGLASAKIELGTAVNPDIDTKLNIWITGSDTINIKNRLGASYKFHFWHFGGN